MMYSTVNNCLCVVVVIVVSFAVKRSIRNIWNSNDDGFVKKNISVFKMREDFFLANIIFKFPSTWHHTGPTADHTAL